MRPSPFADFDKRFRQAQRLHGIVFGVVLGLWVMVAATIITVGVAAVRAGPTGLAAEAGRAVAAFEDARGQAKAEAPAEGAAR